MLNSDVICEYPFPDLLKAHKSTKGAEGTIVVTQVKDPSRYGVVLYDKNRQISAFVEKPKEFVGDRINAGLYILNPSVVGRVPENKKTSIERVIFPEIVKDKGLFSFDLHGYWADIGKPWDYLKGSRLHLNQLQSSKSTDKMFVGSDSKEDYEIVAPCYIDSSAKIGKGCVIGPCVVIGQNVIIGENTVISDSAIFSDVTVGNNVNIMSCILDSECTVRNKCLLKECTIVGKGSTIHEGVALSGVPVGPHKNIKQSLQLSKDMAESIRAII